MSKYDFDQFDARDNLDTPANWPFGEKVLDHAVNGRGFPDSSEEELNADSRHKRYHCSIPRKAETSWLGRSSLARSYREAAGGERQKSP